MVHNCDLIQLTDSSPKLIKKINCNIFLVLTREISFEKCFSILLNEINYKKKHIKM